MTTESFDHVWLARTLDSPTTYFKDRLEEMAFCVAQDLEWVDDFKRRAIERLKSLPIEKETIEAPPVVLEPRDEALLNQAATAKTKSESIRTGPVVAKPMYIEPPMEVVEERNREPSSERLMAADAEEVLEHSLSELPGISVETFAEVQNDPASINIDSSPIKVLEQTKALKTEKTPEKSPTIASPLARNNIPDHNMIPLRIIGPKDVTLSDESENISFNSAHETLPGHVPEILATLGPQVDYFEPINLDSPKKMDSRHDSAYFSAVESPDHSSVMTKSPRMSVAFASLPPRQPFAKKSMGARISRTRTSTFDGNKSTSKTPIAAQTIVGSNLAEIDTSDAPGAAQVEFNPQSTLGPAQEQAEQIAQLTTAEAQESLLKASQPVRLAFVQKDTDNPFDADSKVISEKSTTNVMIRDDDEWLPKFDAIATSPKKIPSFKVPLVPDQQAVKDTKTAGQVAANTQKAVISMPSMPLQNSEQAPQIKEEDKTPGPIKAAMQAASARATSYLRQARTAFGSPSINHTRVFKTTTPLSSPPKSRFKVEPQTPKIYPDLSAQSVKPSLIPSRSPRKSPIKTEAHVDDEQVRRSPRRSPKKGVPAMQSMAVIAARNASAKAAVQPEEENKMKSHTERTANDTPQKMASKPIPKHSLQPKQKPLSIRVATASQREIDQTKERKNQPNLNSNNAATSTSILSRSTNENGQLEYLSKSQSGIIKKPGVSRQIKALAAATQAKEKAEKEQVRREQQRKDMERKRHENAKRQADEEERRKAEADDLHRKRKANADQRTVSSSSKKQTIRPVANGTFRESHIKEHDMPVTTTTSTANLNRQSIKRPIIELEESATIMAVPESKRQRVSEQTESRIVPSASTAISKPVRVSLQKSTLFGHPGEPGYKKPGTTFTKSAPVVDAVKFSTETIRFASTTETNPSKSAPHPPLPPQTLAAALLPASESIELPEINSDYSDSEDDDGKAGDAFERPAWAETPELRKQLRRQQRIDPDEVFGPMKPLQMEEMFKGKERSLVRFRPRSSSANWSEGDKLSAEEEIAYARAMGYRN